MPSVVLITGVSRYLGAALAARLSADPDVDRLIGIDAVAPRDPGALGRTEFVRADIRNPLIAKVVRQARVETVVHTGALAPVRASRVALQDHHVTGTMQLLAACQTSETVGRVVVASTTAVYGSSPADPAQFTEQSPPAPRPEARFARDAVEIENYTRGFARRRPDVPVIVLRFAPVVGPGLDTALTRYLRLPVLPTPLGFDPRLQVLHETDAVDVLRLASRTDRPGVFNVAPDDVVPLSQALRWAGRPRVPIWAPTLEFAGTFVRNTGLADASLEDLDFLSWGRVVDTTRLRTDLGFRPRFSTAEALLAQLRTQPAVTRIGASAVGVVQRYLTRRSQLSARAGAPMALSGVGEWS